MVYIDESYIHSNHTASNAWSDGVTSGLKCNINKVPRLIMVHAGGEMGFLQNCLLLFKSGAKSVDYHDDMNGANYTKWIIT